MDERLRLSPAHTSARNTSILLKCRFANARPDPDFRYCSKLTASRSLANFIVTMSDHGRFESVWPDGPWLCHSSRLSTSFVMPTYCLEGSVSLRRT